MKKDQELSPELYEVARKKGTEAPFSGKYWDSHEKGMYKCAICGAELFSSENKFDSGTGWPGSRSSDSGVAAEDSKSELSLPGWPSFTEPANLKNIELKQDLNHGMVRTEVLCKKCGAHLGHVFDDGPEDKGGKRYCINSVCLELDLVIQLPNAAKPQN